MIQKFLNWLVVSSKDPSQVSLTIQGLLVANAGIIMLVLHYLHVPITDIQYADLSRHISTAISSVLVVVGAVNTLWGIARKIAITIKAKISK